MSVLVCAIVKVCVEIQARKLCSLRGLLGFNNFFWLKSVEPKPKIRQ